jgi:hypothetical protein
MVRPSKSAATKRLSQPGTHRRPVGARLPASTSQRPRRSQSIAPQAAHLEGNRGHSGFCRLVTTLAVPLLGRVSLAGRPRCLHIPGMPRTARASAAGYCYHVLNRGNGRARVFHEAQDYLRFVRLLRQACARVPMWATPSPGRARYSLPDGRPWPMLAQDAQSPTVWPKCVASWPVSQANTEVQAEPWVIRLTYWPTDWPRGQTVVVPRNTQAVLSSRK